MSMLLSATVLTAFADGSQTTTVTYTSLSPDEKNVYTVNIPSTVNMNEGEDTKTINITLGKAYSLEDNYVVYVDIAKSVFKPSLSPSNQKSTIFRLYLDGDKTSSYYRSYELTNSDGEQLYYLGNTQFFGVATFHADASTNTGGSLTLTYLNTGDSTDKQYKEAGTYSGTLTFNIYGQYE
jgi:hypothetical protein